MKASFKLKRGGNVFVSRDEAVAGAEVINS